MRETLLDLVSQAFVYLQIFFELNKIPVRGLARLYWGEDACHLSRLDPGVPINP